MSLNDEQMYVKELCPMLDDFGIQSTFEQSCRIGDIKAVQAIVNNYPHAKVSANHCYAIRAACENGNLEVVEFLWNTCHGRFNINQLVQNDGVMKWYQETLINCHRYNQTEMLAFLRKQTPNYDFQRLTPKFFRAACVGGHLNLAQQIWEENKGLEVDLADLFQEIAMYGHLHILKWFITIHTYRCPASTENEKVGWKKIYSCACVYEVLHRESTRQEIIDLINQLWPDLDEVWLSQTKERDEYMTFIC